MQPLNEFSKVAPYLSDPLVLVGFTILVGFLTARLIVNSGVIPVLTRAEGARTIRSILLYGFLFGMAIIVLGFALKYRELSQAEQSSVVDQIRSELRANSSVVSELIANTATLTGAASSVAEVLRTPRISILGGVFPVENLQPDAIESMSDAYNQRMDWLTESGLLEDPVEVQRYQAACGSISRTVTKTLPTIRSLGDADHERYVIQTAARDANLDVFRKIRIAELGELAALYERMGRVRAVYDRIARRVPEYLAAVGSFCRHPQPLRDELSAVLAVERLTISLLSDYAQQLANLGEDLREAEARVSI